MSSILNSSMMVYQQSTSFTIIFIVTITLLIPSLLCSLFICYNCIRMPALRNHPPNRVILVLLVFLFLQALFDLPCRLYYLYNGTSPIHNEDFCQLWSLIITTLRIIDLHLMAVASIERYLLIFHHTFLAKNRLILSIIPIVISIIYPIAWHVTLTYSSWWCTYKPDYSVVECGLPCYLTNSVFYLSFIIYVHHLLPIFITSIANVSLIVAVLHQKTKMKRNNSWRKSLRMTTQLLSIAFLYLIIWLPHCIFAAVPLFTQGSAAVTARAINADYFVNFMSIFVCLYPFIALLGLFQLHDKTKQFINVIRPFCLPCCKKRSTLVAPAIDRPKP